jgi:glycosyltransferase involved in cell wall biosynthesis
MKPDRHDLSLVIACYNEEPILEPSVEQILRVLDLTRFSYEVIFVDDASTDRTRAIIDEILARNPDRPLRRLFHAENRGRGATVADGFLAATGEFVGFIDIDLEVHARYIPWCVLELQRGADVATALRTYKFRLRSIDRYILSKGYAWLMRTLLGVPLRDTETGFKFFRRSKLLPVLQQIEDKRWFWDTEVMVRSYLCGYKIVEVPCLFVRRFDKGSSVRAWADTWDYFIKLWQFRKVVQAIRRQGAGARTEQEAT